MPPIRRALPLLVTILWVGRLRGETITLPAAASVVGAAPFYSDVRAFNTSYSQTLSVTADYRCFIGTCGGGTRTFSLAPRESRAFDDVCAGFFGAPASAGAIEFTHGGAEGQLVVTSRLYSTWPVPTVGMFVPGLNSSAAYPVGVLTSVRNGGAGAGFRTNVGMYNPSGSSVSPIVRVYDSGNLVGTARLPAPLGPRSGGQINDVFGAIGAAGLSTENAVAVVDSGDSSIALFSYAAVIDNATSDPSFVPAGQDQPLPAAQTVIVSVRAWDFSPGGPVSAPLVLTVGTTYTVVFRDVDPPGTPNPRHGFSGISDLGLPSSDDISPGHEFVIPSFTPQPYQRGTYPFLCTQNDCGGDPEQHNGMIGVLIVQ
jgi:hypothetical protein